MPRLIRCAWLVTALLVTIVAVAQPVHAAGGGQTKFQLPGAARNRGVCGLWTQVLGASS
jgi:hypothetical protein